MGYSHKKLQVIKEVKWNYKMFWVADMNILKCKDQIKIQSMQYSK